MPIVRIVMQNLGSKLATVAMLGLAASVALAGRGGSGRAIEAAVLTGTPEAIIAEVERAQDQGSDDLVRIVTHLTQDSRFAVRDVAAWWFAQRPVLRDQLARRFIADLTGGDTAAVRNAADFLGRTRTLAALPALRAAIQRDGLGVGARRALVRAVGFMADPGGNNVLIIAMTDPDPEIRCAAAAAWRDIVDQRSAGPVMVLLGDLDPDVRAQAANVVGAMAEASAHDALEALVLRDPDPAVRRNAAWALGQIGDLASQPALVQATTDPSGLVREIAKAALAQLTPGVPPGPRSDSLAQPRSDSLTQW